MGLQVVPAYIGQDGYEHPVELDRNMLKGVWGRTGVLRHGDFALTPDGSALEMDVADGGAFIAGVESNQQGGYFVWSNALETLSWPSPSGSPRIDSLLLRVADDQYGTIPGTPEAYWDIVSGVPAGSPVARADSDFNSGGAFYVPGAWFRVADVRINNGDTVINPALITLANRWVRGSGAIILAHSSQTITDATYGDKRRDVDTGSEYVWNGAAWIELWPTFVVDTTATIGQGTTESAAVDSVTVTAMTGDVWEVRCQGTWNPNGDNRPLRIRVKQSGTVIVDRTIFGPNGGQVNDGWEFTFLDKPTAGSRTYTWTGMTLSFTGQTLDSILTARLVKRRVPAA